MPKESLTELIILHSTKVGENSIVLHTISSQYGVQSFITSIGKNSPMALFMPLSLTQAKITENPKSTLWRASKLQVLYPLSSLRSQLHKNTMTLFLSEVLYRSIRNGANEIGLYQWCKHKILELDALESDYASYHLHFLIELCAVLGFSPTMQSLAPFAGEHFSQLEELLNLSLSERLLYPLNGETRNEIAQILIQYLSYHLDIYLDIKSLKVLRELYA